MSSLRIRAASVIVISLFCATAILSECNPVSGGFGLNSFVENFRIFPGGDNPAINPSTFTQQAASWWNNSCAENVPPFSHAGVADIPVHVCFHAGANPGVLTGGGTACFSCGCSSTFVVGGQVQSSSIQIYERAGDGTDCTGSYSEIAAHELGHVLGLSEAPARCPQTNQSCFGGIMFVPIPGVIPSTQDCEAVDDIWFTTEELEDPDNDDGGGPCGV